MTTPKARRAERFPVWMSPELSRAIRVAAVRDTTERGLATSRAEWMREAATMRLEAEHPDLYATLGDDA